LTVETSVESELVARGFRIGADATFKIVIDLEVFFNDYKPGLGHSESVADLQMNVSLFSKDGNRLYARRIATQGRYPKIGTEYARRMLNTALDKGIDTLFDDWAFASFLLSKTNPAVGSPPHPGDRPGP